MTRDRRSTSPPPEVGNYRAPYTSKDLILYALSVGYENDEEEVKFLFEKHASFEAVPTFAFVLSFCASKSKAQRPGIQPFPPPMMSTGGVVPKEFIVDGVSPQNMPLIHVWQKIEWHRPLPVPYPNGSTAYESPVHTVLNSRVLAVQPKSVGTFVTTETGVSLAGGSQAQLCTLQASTLVLGMPAKNVRPYSSPGKQVSKKASIPLERKPVFVWNYQTTPTQALLYRLTGDSNDIHADPTLTSDLLVNSTRPLLHGLCTLAIAVRGILKFLRSEQSNVRLKTLEARFTKPVLVGDALILSIWEERPHSGVLLFRVKNDLGVVLDGGHLEYIPSPHTKSDKNALQSKL